MLYATRLAGTGILELGVLLAVELEAGTLVAAGVMEFMRARSWAPASTLRTVNLGSGCEYETTCGGRDSHIWHLEASLLLLKVQSLQLHVLERALITSCGWDVVVRPESANVSLT